MRMCALKYSLETSIYTAPHTVKDKGIELLPNPADTWCLLGRSVKNFWGLGTLLHVLSCVGCLKGANLSKQIQPPRKAYELQQFQHIIFWAIGLGWGRWGPGGDLKQLTSFLF